MKSRAQSTEGGPQCTQGMAWRTYSRARHVELAGAISTRPTSYIATAFVKMHMSVATCVLVENQHGQCAVRNTAGPFQFRGVPMFHIPSYPIRGALVLETPISVVEHFVVRNVDPAHANIHSTQSNVWRVYLVSCTCLYVVRTLVFCLVILWSLFVYSYHVSSRRAWQLAGGVLRINTNMRSGGICTAAYHHFRDFTFVAVTVLLFCWANMERAAERGFEPRRAALVNVYI